MPQLLAAAATTAAAIGAAVGLKRAAGARGGAAPAEADLHASGAPALPAADLAASRAARADFSDTIGLVPALPPGLRLPALTTLALARCGLQSLPDSLCAALPNLVVLDVSGNHLTTLPPAIGQLTKLARLNAMANCLTSLPPDLGRCRRLTVLGLKSNRLTALPAELGKLTALRELYVTDNELETLPHEIEGCVHLQKLQASFNHMTSLPPTLGRLPRLEMLRVAANRLDVLPAALADAPALAWVSLAGNPGVAAAAAPPRAAAATTVDLAALTLGPALGSGASGDVREAALPGGKRVAVKLFRGDVGPDGRAEDEVAVTRALDHPALTQVLATLACGGGLVVDLVPGAPLADKPRGDPLLRCTYPPGARLAPAAALTAVSRVAAGLAHMHAVGACHGDVYAHNVLCDAAGEATLVDYGASFFYNGAVLPAGAAEAWDGRALGLLAGEVAGVVGRGWGRRRAVRALRRVERACARRPPARRPRLADVAVALEAEAAAVGGARVVGPGKKGV